MNADVVDCALMVSHGDCDPGIIMLVAMVADEVQSLGRLHRAGLWKDDPAEMGEWLRRANERPRGMNTFAAKEAAMEWQMWGGCTDSLLRTLQALTPVRLSRATLVKMAKEHSASRRPAGSTKRTRQQRRAMRKASVLPNIQVQRSNRVSA